MTVNLKFEDWALNTLGIKGTMHSLQIYRAAEEDGVRANLGLIYASMQNLERGGLVTSERRQEMIVGRMRSKYYWSLTDSGHRRRTENQRRETC